MRPTGKFHAGTYPVSIAFGDVRMDWPDGERSVALPGGGSYRVVVADIALLLFRRISRN
jgi:hypothetical protein